MTALKVYDSVYKQWPPVSKCAWYQCSRLRWMWVETLTHLKLSVLPNTYQQLYLLVDRELCPIGRDLSPIHIQIAVNITISVKAVRWCTVAMRTYNHHGPQQCW